MSGQLWAIGLLAIIATACGSSSPAPGHPDASAGSGGNAGAGAAAGSSGSGGTSGASGSSGAAGVGGTAAAGGDGGGGSSGSTGGVGAGGSGGSGGGTGGVGGGTGGTGGTGGASGSAGTAGAAGSAGTCASPSGLGTCGTAPQCGCSSTENCDVTADDGATACVSAGTTAPWTACTTTGECVKGYTCVSGVCRAFCGGPSDVCPGANAECIQVMSGTAPIPGMYVCTRSCYPVDPSTEDATYDACGPGLGCFPSMSHTSDCAGPTTASGTQGADCANLSGYADDTKCAPGYFCDDNTLTCLKFCLNASPYCPGSYCHSFNPLLYDAAAEIGYCQ